MENYPYNYPDSGESSPRSREIEFENPAPWEDQQTQPPHNYKAKFMCSYGGKIHPRPHDNLLAYIGGETKILSVDRNIKFPVMISKLSALCADSDVSFKYQLPGEDLDALISVTNDDDLEHMMHEYDRLFRASAKPARMRLFVFPVVPSPASFGSDGGKSDRDRFVEALNSGPSRVVEEGNKRGPSNVDFLFGLEKSGAAGGIVPPPVPAVKVPDLQEFHGPPGHDDRVIGSDPVMIQNQLQRMHIREQEQQNLYRKGSDENFVGDGYSAGDYYVQKLPEKVSPASIPVSVPPAVTAPPGYWPEKQMAGGGFPHGVTVTTAPPPPQPTDQPVYMIPAHGAPVYHTPVMRPVTSQPGPPGYYVQRMGGAPEVYREQPVYNVVQQPPQQQPPPQPISAAAGHMGMVRPSGAAPVGVTDAGYTQMAYDGAVGRQVYYAAAGGVGQQQPPQQQYAAVSGMAMGGEIRHGQEPKVAAAKVPLPQASV